MEMQKGQKLKLSEFTSSQQLTITVTAPMNGGEADCTLFGVDAAGKLSDERYFIFYNQLQSPENAVSMRMEGEAAVFSADLSLLPAQIEKLVVTVASDSGMRALADGKITLGSGGNTAEYRFSGASFAEEKALILCELYLKGGVWRYHVVASGFNGGLSALLAHFGGTEAPAAPTPAPKPAPAPEPSGVSAQPSPPPAPAAPPAKINLRKSGDTHKINLSKNGGEIHANLNWNAGRKKLFGGGQVDLDLACMFRLKNGQQGVIQALGNAFGSATQPPYILLDQDDRSGSSAGGENMFFKKPELIDFAVVFAYIYEGVPNWRSTNACVTLYQQGAPDIEIRIDNPDGRDRFCVVASLTGTDGQLAVRREERFFPGHREVDQHYHFGFRWKQGHK